METSWKVGNIGDLECLPSSHVEEAAAITAAAFLNSPSYAYIYEGLADDASRLEALKWLFVRKIRIHISEGSTRCAFYRESGKLPVMVCFFLMLSPKESMSLWDMIKHGILTFPIRFGWKAFSRLLQVIQFHDEDEAAFFAVNDRSKYCLLERMVVRPEFQGGGVGSKCLKQALSEVEAAGWGVLLSTQEEINVKFYSKLGFDILQRKDYFNTTSRDKNITVTMAKRPQKALMSENNLDTEDRVAIPWLKWTSTSIVFLTCLTVASRKCL